MEEKNVLNIQIKVTDEQMNKLIHGKLEELPDDKIQDILGNALNEFLKTDNGQRLFYTKEYYRNNPQPTDLLKNMISNAISKDLLKPCVDEFVNVLKDNYYELLQNTMIRVFSEMFFTEVRETHLKIEMNDMLNSIVNSKLNNTR